MSELDELAQVTPSDEDTAAGEGSPAPAEPTQDTPRKWAGKYDAPEDLEKAYQEAQRKLSDMGEENARFKNIITTPAPAQYGYPAPAEEPTVDFGVTSEEFFADPQAALSKVAKAAAKTAAAAATKAAREEAAKVAQMSQMETQFYSANKDLDPKRDRPLVDYFASQLNAEIAHLQPFQRQQLYPDPMKTVAEKVREYRTGLVEEARTKPTKPTAPHVGSGGGDAGAPTPSKAKPKTEKELQEAAFTDRLKMYHH